MKLEVFADHNFMMALNKLMDSPGISMRVGYKLATMRIALVAEYNKYEELRKGLVSQFAEKDDLGNLKTQPDSDVAIFAGGNDKLFSEKIKELQQVEVQITTKVKLSEIEKAELTPMEVVRLRDLIEE